MSHHSGIAKSRKPWLDDYGCCGLPREWRLSAERLEVVGFGPFFCFTKSPLFEKWLGQNKEKSRKRTRFKENGEEKRVLKKTDKYKKQEEMEGEKTDLRK